MREKLLNMIEVIAFATRTFVFSAFSRKKCNFGFKTANPPAEYVVALYSGSTFSNEPDNGFQRHDASEKCHERFGVHGGWIAQTGAYTAYMRISTTTHRTHRSAQPVLRAARKHEHRILSLYFLQGAQSDLSRCR